MKNALYAVSHNSILKEKCLNNYYLKFNFVAIQPSVETFFYTLEKEKLSTAIIILIVCMTILILLVTGVVMFLFRKRKHFNKEGLENVRCVSCESGNQGNIQYFFKYD